MSEIQLINPFNQSTLEAKGNAFQDSMGNHFPCVNGAYRFVTEGNYTASFGFQWNRFEKTQIDRFQKVSKQSLDRFFRVTQWNSEDLSSQNILEVGSGAGRFTQVVLSQTEANIYSVDYSDAVEANYRNNGPSDRLKLFQASIYQLPFFPAQFEKVFCFGVLQHTPDVKQSIKCLIEMVKPGGELIVDFYPVTGWYTKIHAKYLLRPITRKMSHVKLLRLIESNIDWLMKAYFFFEKVGVGRIINRFLPICDINRTIPGEIDPQMLREWVILDTFDMFSPAYDQPQKLKTVEQWFQEFGMKNVTGSVIPYGNGNKVTVVKGTK